MCEVQRGTNSTLTVRDTQTLVHLFTHFEHTDQDHQTIEKQTKACWSDSRLTPHDSLQSPSIMQE